MLFTRFGTGQLPSASTVIQSGDLLHVVTTDDARSALKQIAGNPPGGQE
jgi:trk system potassium uptake protein TrkA